MASGGTKKIWARRSAVWVSSAALLSAGWFVWNTAVVQSVPEAAELRSEAVAGPFEPQEKISIPSAGIDMALIYPASASAKILTAALDRGVVHYPESPLPSAAGGNSFFFGHSSAREEKNPARSAFTNLRDVVPGDIIEIWHKERVYLYRATSVKILKPWEAEVYFASDKKKLTLSTCWPVGDPNNRFIVEADFVRSIPQRSFVADLSP